MNAQIVKLFTVVLGLYALLVGFTSYWSIFDAKNLEQNTANRRPLLEEQRIRRGDIRSVDGELLARSRPEGSGKDRIFVREYPSGDLFGNPIGYNFVDRGRVGFELSRNDELVGDKTEFLSVLDELRGHAQEGSDVITTLNARAQRVAKEALAGRAGSVVAIEPDTGRIRVMVSEPPFDPNQIPDRFEQIARDKSAEGGSPLVNRATQSGYPPGSTMKVVTATAALDSGDFEPEDTVNGDSGVKISGVPLDNAGGEDFGEIDLTSALTNSVNVVWAQVAEEIGKERMYEYMTKFGFNSKPPIDYPPDQLVTSGVFEGGKTLDEGDSVDIGRVAIGQERLLVTPLQMAEVAATVANGGVRMKPRLLEKVIDSDGREDEIKPSSARRVMSGDTSKTLTDMMTDVVNEGTASGAGLEGIDAAGKTGTAEIDPSRDINQVWFIGFAPEDDPQIAIAVTIERTQGGSGGSDAAPIGTQVMEALLND